MKAVRERVDRTTEETPPSRLSSSADRAFARVDIASLVFFRVAFGALMLWEVFRYFSKGWIEAFFVEPSFHFTYFGFDWVRPWPGEGMVVHFALLGVLAILIILGLWYRIAMTLFLLGFSYVFLLEQARYLNHFYLIVLFSLLMVFVPANRAFSLDARGRRDFLSSTVPAWCVWILRIQMGLVYFFSGVAKINSDWLQGEPLRAFLSVSTDFPIIGGLFTQEWLVYLFAYASLLLDLLAFPLLLWRRTRLLTFLALVGFHLMNATLFRIGIFPWFAIAATALFFPPDWPRRVRNGLWKPAVKTSRGLSRRRRAVGEERVPSRRRLTLILVGAYVAVQVVVPLRHFAYPGEVSWTEEGHRFSWHMMLRQKRTTPRFFVTTPSSGQTFEVDLRHYLEDWQIHPMSTRPYLVLQLAHKLADRFTPPGAERVEVRAHIMASLNSRPPQLLVDPRVDLAGVEPGPPPADWIVPLGSDLYIPPPAA